MYVVGETTMTDDMHLTFENARGERPIDLALSICARLGAENLYAR